MRFRGVFLFLLVFLSRSFAQNPEPNDLLDMYDVYEEEEMDEESMEIEPISPMEIEAVEFAEELLDYIDILREKDSLIHQLPKIEDKEELEIIFYPNTDKIMCLRKMVFNENKAWDFVYDSYFDEEGDLRLFIRKYNTFDSECAEIAFEDSRYYFDKENHLVKKTYSIVDENNNNIELDYCWVDREPYTIYKTSKEAIKAIGLEVEEILSSNQN